MNKNNKSILLALSLGDGCIRKRIDKRYNTTNYFLNIKHSIKQKAYLEYKASIANSVLGGKQNEVKIINNNGYAGCKYEKGSKELRYIYSMLYIDGKKVITRNVLNLLTPQGIAIWYMDDGSLYAQKKNGRIHAYQMVLSTCCDTQDEAQIIIDYFNEVWSVKFGVKKNKNKYSLTCNTKEIRKFIKIVRPYVSKIQCMKYKIDKIND